MTQATAEYLKLLTAARRGQLHAHMLALHATPDERRAYMAELKTVDVVDAELNSAIGESVVAATQQKDG